MGAPKSPGDGGFLRLAIAVAPSLSSLCLPYTGIYKTYIWRLRKFSSLTGNNNSRRGKSQVNQRQFGSLKFEIKEAMVTRQQWLWGVLMSGLRTDPFSYVDLVAELVYVFQCSIYVGITMTQKMRKK